MPDRLIPPHGGSLINLVVDGERASEIRAGSRDWPSWEMTPRQLCDLELLLNGGFSPLTGFMGRADYESVCQTMRLADGTLWPIPVVLDVPERTAASLGPRATLALRDPEGALLAVLRVEEVWRPDIESEAREVYQTLSPEHPGVSYLLNETHPYFVGGRLEGLQLPAHYDFRSLRATPAELRAEFARLGWRRVGRLPDPEPHTSRPSGVDASRRQAGGGESALPPGGRDDSRRRRGPLHESAVLSGRAIPQPAAHDPPGAAPPGDADGRTARGALACPHP